MVNLSISGDSIVFEFINSNYYLQNGKIATPINSLALITDESNIATFKKASSNDIFVAATYDELGKSKNELIEWFKNNAVGATGGGDLDDYYTKEQTDALLDEKADISEIPDVSNYIDNVDYDSTNHLIKFFHNQTLIDSVDATDFIKDGMVSNVYIEGGNLVISFNTDAGKEDIEIPLTDIFNPNNYYDKTATDTLLDAKLNVSDFNTYSSATQTAIQGKASQSDLNTVSGAVDTLSGQLDDKVDLTAYTAYTSATDATIATKASNADLQTVSGVVDTKLNTSDFNTYSGGVQTAITSIEGDITDVQTALQGKASNADLQTVSGAVDTKLAISDFNSYSSSTMTLIGNKASIDSVYDKATINSYTASTATVLNGAVQHSEFDPYSSSTEMALSERVRTADFAQYTAATATAIDGKQATLVSGTNIKTVNGNSILGSGDIEVGVEVDDELDIDSPNAVANSAITKAIQDNELVVANALIALQDDVDGKADASDLNGKVDVSAYTAYTAATDTALQGKADASDLNGKVDVSTYTAYTAATDTALNGKQATLVSGTNIKTINNTSLLGSGNIDIQGGGGQTVTSVTQAEYDALVVKDPDTFYIISDATGSTITIDPSLNSGSTNAVANSAITIAIDEKADTTAMTQALSSKVDTSMYNTYTAATNTAISTINTALGGYKLWKGTQAQYDAIVTKDEDTIYFIVNNS